MRVLPRVQAGLDGWLAPRWRALFTWASCAAAAVSAHHFGVVSPLADTGYEILGTIQTALSLPVPAAIQHFRFSAPHALVLVSFQPLVLRVGWWRTLLWWLLGIVGFTAYWAELVNFEIYRTFPSVVQRMIHAMVTFGMSALVIIGRRSRPWMVLPAVVAFAVVEELSRPLTEAAASLFSGLEDLPKRLAWWGLGWAAALIAFGAVLIYGTKPLPPRTRAVASEPDAAADAPAPAP